MNIFATDSNPIAAANHLDLKRVVKMILESFQLMSNAMWLHGHQGFYKLSHKNHPCSHWTAASRENFRWLFRHAIELVVIYVRHYKRPHKCFQHAQKCAEYLRDGKFSEEALTPHVNCTEFKQCDDVHFAYRVQMLQKWENDKRTPHWANPFQLELIKDWNREYESKAF